MPSEDHSSVLSSIVQGTLTASIPILFGGGLSLWIGVAQLESAVEHLVSEDTRQAQQISEFGNHKDRFMQDDGKILHDAIQRLELRVDTIDEHWHECRESVQVIRAEISFRHAGEIGR